MNVKPAGNFERVNQLVTAASVIEFLEVTESLPFTRSCKERMREIAPALPGHHVLDVGCGLGHEARRLRALVGANGRVVGLDASETAIMEARKRSAGTAAAPEFVQGYADQLPFDDAGFDIVRAERVAEYVESPAAMFAQMCRVLRPGGKMVVFDFDYAGAIIDAGERSLAERVGRIVANAVPNPWIGGQLWGHFVRLRLRNLQVVPMSFVIPFDLYAAMTRSTLKESVARGELSQHENEAWWQGLEQSQRRGTFFAALTGMIVCGVK